MAFMKTKQFESTPNFVESEIGLTPKTYTLTQNMATEINGRKIIKAGTVIPSNDAEAYGLLIQDVDMTDDEKRPEGVYVAGRMLEKRLPQTVTAEAKTALKGITFVTTTDPVF